MSVNKHRLFFATVLALALHAVVLMLVGTQDMDRTPDHQEEIVFLEATMQSQPPAAPPSPPLPPPTRVQQLMASDAPKTPLQNVEQPEQTPLQAPQRASMEAPPAPTAQEWAFASSYTLKNSKAYRHTWGQQVRSMMGTAIEGPDQGAVRFRIEIAPNGTLTKLDTLWTTSAVAEQRARKAVENLPALPPTPTGKPLIFEKTISFSPFASDGPPLYKDDCLPDPPAFRNPFAWNGQSPQERQDSTSAEPPLDPQALEECMKQLPKDSIEAERARDQRLMDQWGWRSGPLSR
jgi:hypothetical protein